MKLLIFVKDGASTTLSVPPVERARLALNYGRFAPQSTSHGIAYFEVAAAPHVLTFEPCSRANTPSGWTSFAGGFIVKGAQCARVDISRRHNHLHTQIALGKSCG